MEFREDKGTGYMYCYNPLHPCANKAGKVLEHVYVVYKKIKRKLRSGECVHHIARDRKNNKSSNLRLMTIEEHAILHAKEDRDTVRISCKCFYCNKNIYTTEKAIQKFCSAKCAGLGSRKFDITAARLRKLVWKYPTTKVAIMLGVSDKAVEKRCKLLGVDKPPRGYWTKK